MDYLLKTSFLMVLFYMVYQIFLYKETLFATHRIYLLVGIALSFIIPSITIPHYIEYEANAIVNHLDSRMYQANPVLLEETPLNWSQLLLNIYYIGAILVFSKFLVELASLKRLIKSHDKEKKNGLIFIATQSDISPFSFFNYIIYNPTHFTTDELEIVLSHETIHAKDWHSIDVVIAELACAFMWFNPIMWFYKRSMKQNLEFLADMKANASIDATIKYELVMLKTGLPNYQNRIANNFFNSLIKKRIVMLHRPKSKSIKALKYLLLIPMLATFMMSFNTKTVYVEKETVNIVQQDTLEYWNVQKFVISKKSSDKQLEEIKNRLKKEKVELTFSNLSRDENGFLTRINIDFKSEASSGNYQINASEKFKPIALEYDVTGKTLTIGNDPSAGLSTTIELEPKRVKISNKQDTIVDKQVIVIEKSTSNSDSKSNTNTNTDTRINTENNHETIKSSETKIIVVSEENGKIVQIDTVLKNDKNKMIWVSDDGKHTKIDASETGSQVYFNTPGAKPIFILDGEAITEAEINSIKPNKIKSVNVIKGINAKKKYGIKGKDGVVEIYTQTNKDNDKEFHYTIKVDESSNPKYKVKTEGNNFVYWDLKDPDKKNGNAFITKTSSEETLASNKSILKSMGLKVTYSKLQRNKKGEITQIKITVKDEDGKKTSATYWNDDGISMIEYGKRDSQLFVNSLE